VDRAALFYETHNAGHTRFPYPKELFHKFVDENDGYFPVTLEALDEGTCAHIHVPVFQITAEGEWTPLTTFMETLLTMVWYPSTVATLSRKVKDVIQEAFDKTVDPEAQPLIASRLHDFGFRGCTCLEQSVIGGTAHLLNFDGSDTMSACYYAQFTLNGGRPVGASIPATEHSVMTSWRTERMAIENMIERVGDGAFSCVMDSYDYDHAINVVLPEVAPKKVAKGGFMVVRPDSGDPKEQVIKGLRAVDKTFGAVINKKGYRVPINAGVIQGDGMNYRSIAGVVQAVMDAGYSAQCVAYGMGGGLLQRINRDSMGFATKLSHIRYADGSERNVMKMPHGDWTKASLPGVLGVKRVGGIPMVFPKSEVAPHENMLKLVYDKKPIPGAFSDSFDTLRARVEQQWRALPKVFDPRSESLQILIKQWLAEHRLD
jgi:nicotinic acid phosphoribosyltransferase